MRHTHLHSNMVLNGKVRAEFIASCSDSVGHSLSMPTPVVSLTTYSLDKSHSHYFMFLMWSLYNETKQLHNRRSKNTTERLIFMGIIQLSPWTMGYTGSVSCMWMSTIQCLKMVNRGETIVLQGLLNVPPPSVWSAISVHQRTTASSNRSSHSFWSIVSPPPEYLHGDTSEGGEGKWWEF